MPFRGTWPVPSTRLSIVDTMRSFAKSKTESLFIRAEKQEESGNLKSAFRLYLAAAKAGDTSCQINVGNFYDDGLGVRRNRSAAMYWYKRAYRRGQACAAHNIGVMWRNEGKYRRALYWFKKAVRLGEDEDNLDIAKHYLQVEPNVSRAVSHLEKVCASKRVSGSRTRRSASAAPSHKEIRKDQVLRSRLLGMWITTLIAPSSTLDITFDQKTSLRSAVVCAAGFLRIFFLFFSQHVEKSIQSFSNDISREIELPGEGGASRCAIQDTFVPSWTTPHILHRLAHTIGVKAVVRSLELCRLKYSVAAVSLSGQNFSGVVEIHLPNRVQKNLLGLWSRLLRGSVHPDFQLIHLSPLPQQTHRLAAAVFRASVATQS